MRDPEAGVRDPEAGVRDPEAGVRDPEADAALAVSLADSLPAVIR